MNSETQTEPGRVEMVTLPLAYSLPGGGEAMSYVTVTPEVTQRTLDALRCLAEAAAPKITKT